MKTKPLNSNPKPPFDSGGDNWIIFGRLARELHNGSVKDPKAATEMLLSEPHLVTHAIEQFEALLAALRKVAESA